MGLKGNQFNTAISVLFAGYIALQIPSNAFITRTRPSIYLVKQTSTDLKVITANNQTANMYDNLGNFIYQYSSSPELYWSGTRSFLPRLRRSVSHPMPIQTLLTIGQSILPRCPIPSLFMVYPRRTGFTNIHSLRRKSSLRRVWWFDWSWRRVWS